MHVWALDRKMTNVFLSLCPRKVKTHVGRASGPGTACQSSGYIPAALQGELSPGRPGKSGLFLQHHNVPFSLPSQHQVLGLNKPSLQRGDNCQHIAKWETYDPRPLPSAPSPCLPGPCPGAGCGPPSRHSEAAQTLYTQIQPLTSRGGTLRPERASDLSKVT